MASYRFRAEFPSSYLGASINDPDADILVFSKPTYLDVQLADSCKKNGQKIVVDICDNHFNKPTTGLVYQEIIKLADQIVCPTPTMANLIFQHTKRDSTVIADTYEQKKKAPHADGTSLLWFGHQLNIPSLIRWIKYAKNLRVVTGPNTVLNNYTPWTPEDLEGELSIANCVFLPTIEGCEYKSANRLLDSIMAGCFVVAGDHPAYREFREFVWVGKVETGLKWFHVNQEDLNELVTEGQKYIESKYSHEIIGNQWKSLLSCI